MANELAAWSDQLAATVEMAGQHVVALQNPNNTFAAGILWPMADSAVVVTADHALHQQEIHGVVLPSGRLVGASVAGRDPGTDNRRPAPGGNRRCACAPSAGPSL